MKLLWGIFLGLVISALAVAAEVPAGARLTLETDRKAFFLGEDVSVRVLLHNDSDEPFTVNLGGDYRGSSRSLRYMVTATDARGQQAEDPTPEPWCLGGLEVLKEVPPGEHLQLMSLRIMRYCRLVKPGPYTIRVSHDLGWKKGERPHPVGIIKLRFVIPNQQQARQVIEQLREDSEQDGYYVNNPQPDFRALTHIAYLGPLTNAAREGYLPAIRGLGVIPDDQATWALIELGGAQEAELAVAAATELAGRLPSGNEAIDRHRRIRNLLHDADSAPAVAGAARKMAASMLQRPEPEAVNAGAVLMQRVGLPEDAPLLIAAISRNRNAAEQPRTDERSVLDLPLPLERLWDALTILGKKGYEADSEPTSDIEALVYFHLLADEEGPRSARWMQLLSQHGNSTWYPMRLAAVRSIPKPMPSECRPLVLGLLSDPDLGVRREACAVAGDSGDRRFIPLLLNVISSENESFLLGAANSALSQLGARYERMQAWAGRLRELPHIHLAMRILTQALQVPAGGLYTSDLSPSDLHDLQQAWQVFLPQHEEALRAGETIPREHPSVTRALFARAWRCQLSDGTIWPER